MEMDLKNYVSKFLNDFSIEVMPRTFEKLEFTKSLWPEKTRVYIAHLEGTRIEDMIFTAKKLISEDFVPMPHFPARLIKNKKILETWINKYAEIGVSEALVLAGGVDIPVGEFSNSMEILATGLFEKYNFKRLHVAGHPEGNKDIDKDGGDKNVMDALKWKQNYSRDSKATIEITTQFFFESKPIIKWADMLLANGITLPINIGIAGPARLQTMIKFAIACGVGPSLRVLERRAKDLTKLLFPFEPTAIIKDLAEYRISNPNSKIKGVHIFPLGGIEKASSFIENLRTGKYSR